MRWELAERYVKLILSGFILNKGELYVSKSFLLFKGMKNSFDSLVSQSKALKNGRWLPQERNGCQYFQLSSIPIFTLKRLGLDIPHDYLRQLLVTYGGEKDDKLLDVVKSRAYFDLLTEIANFKKHLPLFYEHYVDSEKRDSLAVSFAILRVILSYTQKFHGMTEHFYRILKSEKFPQHVIPLDSPNYFYKYVRRTHRRGLPDALFNGNKGKPSNNLKLSEPMKLLIVYLKTYGNCTSCSEIQSMIKENSTNRQLKSEIVNVSEQTIRNYLATPEAKNQSLLVRQGWKEFERKIIGYLPLERTKNPLTKILIDGYVVQVKCEGDDKTPTKLTIFAIMDTFSGHVTIEIGDVEDHELLKKAFFKFLSFTNYKLPSEIVSDFHSSRQSKYFQNFRNFLEGNGVHWVASKNPKRKAQLERWFGTLQQRYLCKIAGWVGEGIKSKRKDAHPSEEILHLVTTREYIKHKSELIRLLLSAEMDYNNNAFFKNAASPLDLYHLKQPINYIQLQDFHLPYFFWNCHTVSINGSMVIIKKTINDKSQAWFYRKADFDFSLRNGSEVDAYHNPDDDRFIYLFERNSMRFIAKIEKQLKANEAIMDQTEADRKIIADFGISTAKLHNAYVKRMDDIESNLKEVFGVNPEQLRIEAEFKKKEKDYIGYKAGIVEKRKELDLSKPHKIRKGRSAVKKLRPKSSIAYGTKINDTFG